VRRILFLTGAIVLVDTLFFSALTPLLPHYTEQFGLGKGGAGFLAACYPLGAFVGAIPSGIVVTRLGVKPTVLVGLLGVAVMTAAFGVASSVWELDATRFCQGLASSFSWTGALTWLVASSPPGRRGRLIGQAFAAAIAGALLGPALGGVASVAGTGWTFGLVAIASLGVAVRAAATPSAKPGHPQPLIELLRAFRDRRVVISVWLVILPALLFGSLGVLGPLRLSDLGFGAIAIGAVWLIACALEAGNNVLIGHLTDRHGPLAPVRIGLITTAIATFVLPWPGNRFVVAVVIIFAALSFGTFYTPGMTLLTHAAEDRGLEYGYAFALINLAWAPGQSGGSALGGALAQLTSDAVTYVGLGVLALATFVALRRVSL